MLFKLAVSNVKKSIKDYSIYFLTLVFGVCVFYMFNSIEAQQGIMKVTSTQMDIIKSLNQVMAYISGFVSVILGFLIVYASNFLIKRRKKEFGVYMTLGMEKSRISRILLAETVTLGVFALICGLVLGFFLSQIMSIFTASIFEVDMTGFKFIFSMSAALKAMMYFGIIFIIVMLFNTIIISKYKIIDLIYAKRKNEELKIKNIWVSFFLFLVSLGCLGTAYYLIIKNGLLNTDIKFYTAIILGVIGTFLFFMSLSGFLLKILRANKKLYFRNINSFVLRQISSKINTTYISMTIICLMLFLTISTFASGMSVGKSFSKDTIEKTPYDITCYGYYNKNDKEFDIYPKLDKDLNISKYTKNYAEFDIYSAGKKYKDILNSNDKDSKIWNNDIQIMKLSDFNKLQKMNGKETIKLDKNEYAVSCTVEQSYKLLQTFIDNNKVINIDNKNLKLGIDSILKENNATSIFVSNIGTIIVDDSLTNNMEKINRILNINLNDEKMKQNISELLYDKYSYNENQASRPFTFALSKADVYKNSVGTKAVLSFLAIYLGFVFLISCAAVLALQQLSEASDSKERYNLLYEIGVESSMVNKGLFLQIFIYFMMPLSLAIIHSAVALYVVNENLKNIGKMEVLNSIIKTVVFFIVIYGGYFLATYFGSKRIIIKEK